MKIWNALSIFIFAVCFLATALFVSSIAGCTQFPISGNAKTLLSDTQATVEKIAADEQKEKEDYYVGMKAINDCFTVFESSLLGTDPNYKGYVNTSLISTAYQEQLLKDCALSDIFWQRCLEQYIRGDTECISCRTGFNALYKRPGLYLDAANGITSEK